MKRSILVLMMAALMSGGAVMAETGAPAPKAAPAAMKHTAEYCETHCNIKELEKKVDALKAQSGAEKATMKAHLQKDIADYEKKLAELKAKLEAM